MKVFEVWYDPKDGNIYQFKDSTDMKKIKLIRFDDVIDRLKGSECEHRYAGDKKYCDYCIGIKRIVEEFKKLEGGKDG